MRAGSPLWAAACVGAGLLLYGASLIYGFAGSTLFSDIALAVKGGANPNDIFAGWYNSQAAKDYRARQAGGGLPPSFDATITRK